MCGKHSTNVHVPGCAKYLAPMHALLIRAKYKVKIQNADPEFRKGCAGGGGGHSTLIISMLTKLVTSG